MIKWVRKFLKRDTAKDENCSARRKCKDEETASDQYSLLDAKLHNFLIKYRKKHTTARHRTCLTKGLLIIFGMLVTLSIGVREFWELPENYGAYFGVTSLVLSALVTAIAAWESFDNTSWKWVHYRGMLTELYRIKDQLKFESLAEGGKEKVDVEKHFKEFQKLLVDERSAWETTRGGSILSQVTETGSSKRK